MGRPLCEFGGFDGCSRPATRVVCFSRVGKCWYFSCASCAEKWRRRGWYVIGHILGWVSDPIDDPEFPDPLAEQLER